MGGRVKVYWDGEDKWFHGTVQQFCKNKGYRVKYDDGEKHWEPANTVHKLVERTCEICDEKVADWKIKKESRQELTLCVPCFDKHVLS